MAKKYIQTLLRILLPIILTLFAIKFGLKLISLFWPFVVAYIIALSVSPVIDLFDKKVKIKPKYMSLILIALILFLICLFFWYSISTIIQNIPYFISQLLLLFDDIEKIDLPINLNISMITNWLENNIANISSYMTSMAGSTADILKTIPDIFFKIIITILASYFLIADRKIITRFIFSKLKGETKQKLQIILNESKLLINAYIISQVKLMFFIGIALFVGFLIIGFKIQTIIPLVIVIAFIDFLPIFGSGTILIPWTIYSIITQNYSLGIKLFILYLAITAFRQIISPKVVGEQVGLSPFLSLIFMYIGYIFYDWIGLIMAVPVGLLIINLYKKHFFDSFIRDVKLFLKETKYIVKTEKVNKNDKNKME